MLTQLQAELLRRLRSEDPDAFVDDLDVVHIAHWEGRPLPRPVAVSIGADELERAVHIDADDHAALWPDADARTAGLNLLVTHLAAWVLSEPGAAAVGITRILDPAPRRSGPGPDGPLRATLGEREFRSPSP